MIALSSSVMGLVERALHNKIGGKPSDWLVGFKRRSPILSISRIWTLAFTKGQYQSSQISLIKKDPAR